MSADLVAIVPVKALAEAKSRLAPHLTPLQRADLALDLFDRVLRAVRQTGEIDQCLVVSPDPIIRERARAAGADAIDEEPSLQRSDADLDRQPAYNGALELARGEAIARWRPAAVLVVAADLPFLTADDLANLIARGDERTVVLGSDRSGTGTNALLQRPADAVRFRFGSDSVTAHRDEAMARGYRFVVYNTGGIATDVDVPADLAVLAR